MGQLLLSFRTSAGDRVSEWSSTANALSLQLAAGLEARRYAADFEACRYDGMQDWEFLARRRDEEFVVVLVLCGLGPNRWFVTLNDTQNKPLAQPWIEAAIHPVLESVIQCWSGAYAVRWHADYSTLREM